MQARPAADLIAQQPLACRSDARLLVVDRRDRSIAHAYVRDLPEILAAGDTLVLYTDGVVDARNPSGERFGEQRLRAAIDAAAGGPAEAVADVCRLARDRSTGQR